MNNAKSEKEVWYEATISQCRQSIKGNEMKKCEIRQRHEGEQGLEV